MSGVRHEQSGCDGEPIRAGILIIPTSTGKYGRLWRRDWTVRRFLALCKKNGSIPNGPPLLSVSRQLSRASSTRSMQAHNDNGVPSPTVPLLQSEEFGNGDSSAQSHMDVDYEETDTTEHRGPVREISKQNSSVFLRLQSQISRASSGLSQISIDSKATGISDHGAPSPSTVPLLQSEDPNGASSTRSSNSAVYDVHGCNLTLDQNNNNNPSPGTGSPPVFQDWQSTLRRLPSSALQSQLATEPKKIYNDDEAPSPSSTLPLLHSGSAPAHVAVTVRSDNPDNEEFEELQKKITQIFNEKDLNLLRESGWAKKLALTFDSLRESGKNTGFGESQSVVTYEKQVLAKHFPRFFIRACNRYTIFLLIISACCSLIFEMVEKSPQKGWRDGATIFLAVFLIVTADSVSGFRQARKQEKKILNEGQMKMRVIRNGQHIPVPVYSIVIGELLCLEKDQTIPADGLLAEGSIEVDGKSDKNIDCHENPFLFSGSMVVRGQGQMLVTSVGSSNAMSFKEALLEARINKPNTCAEFFSMCVALLIVLVLFLRFLRKKHDYDDGGPSQIKGEITVQGVLKIFERMFLKPRGTISVLTSFLAAVVIGIQHGMPFVISISLAYWNEKKATTEDVEPQNLSACATMGLVSVICIDISGGLTGEEEEATMKEAVTNFITEGVDIKLVSGDGGLSALTDIASKLGIYATDSTDEAVEGQEIRNLSDDQLKNQADRIKVMVNFLPKDKISMIQCLKEKGHVVAFYGGSTARDALVLKAADVGISNRNSTEMAKKSSDIIISSYRSFNSLIPIYKYGRWAYYNIQKFIQLQLTVMVSSLVITSVATMALRESPITLIQLIWVNLITSILGGLMLITEPHRQELDTLLLKATGNRKEPVITKAMWEYILTQILYQASVLLFFLFKGQAIPGINRRDRKAIIFNSFALCQYFNYGNAMDLEKKWSSGVVMHKVFLLVGVGTAVAMQVVVAEIWARLNLLQWGFCFLIAALSWGLGLAMKVLSPFMPKWSFNHISSHLRRSGWMPSRHDFCFIIFSSLFFLF